MFDLSVWLAACGVILVLFTCLWGVSLRIRDASIVDPFWSLAFIAAGAVYLLAGPTAPDARGILASALVAVWGIRLSWHLFARRAVHSGEDRRYAAMREKFAPNWSLKSLFIVFWFQAALASLASLTLLAAASGSGALGVLDWLGVALWLVGMFFEVVGDAQLARFTADPANRGKVLDRGLWRYTRHPNYFGETCVWWGLGLLGFAGSGWWGLSGAVLMTFLLLRVSGVPMLEEDMASRRPGYAEYRARTSSFVPWPPAK